MTGTIVAAREPLEDVRDQLRLVEELGFESVWVPEANGRDALVTCGVLAPARRRIRLATGIVPLSSRSPALLAMAAATVAEAVDGRFVLGVGLGHRETNLSWHGADPERRLVDAGERIGIVRALLADREVRFMGKFHRTEGRLRGVHHVGSPPIVLAALSAPTARLAGRIADGILLNWVTPRRAAELVEIMRSEAARAGRDPDALVAACYLPVCVTSDRASAHSQLARQIAAFARLSAYREGLASCGFRDDIERVVVARVGSEATGAVSQRLLEALGGVGDTHAVNGWLDQFRDAGINLPILAPFPLPGERSWPSMVETWTALAPPYNSPP
jgi:alkanesulfonate monooxygenase SsuD/methylene tetrahydromethanopterin reductase-like flavin-dependent oxidoreductase (luciferase family)